ncbi:MAG: ProQ/FINO family protein [Kistimonas sp.]|nr:ProQ/FINO family protein [Kistimonas sp.]
MDKLSSNVEAAVAALESRPVSEVMGHEALRVLRLLWPKAFQVSRPNPLKIGINKDIHASGQLSDEIINLGLRCYTQMDRYLENTRSGCVRIDLEGRPCGRVKLREAVNAEILLYLRYCQHHPQRVFIGQLRLVKNRADTQEHCQE